MLYRAVSHLFSLNVDVEELNRERRRLAALSEHRTKTEELIRASRVLIADSKELMGRVNHLLTRRY